MNSRNASTGLTGFQLKCGYSPRVLPPVRKIPQGSKDDTRKRVVSFISDIQHHVNEAQDNLLAAKITQAHYANEYRADDPGYKVGDKVWLNTANRRRDYVMKGSGRVAKFMPRYDGPYEITRAHPETSSYTLKLPARTRTHPTFHVSQLKTFIPNDNEAFPSRKYEEPRGVLTPDGTIEHVIDKIIDERVHRGRLQYYVRWKGFGPAHDEWLERTELEDNEVLDIWEKELIFS